jgi:lysophospholipase L1-like esterase
MFGPSALSRFDRDVLGQTGAKYLIVFQGGSDINQPGSDMRSGTVGVPEVLGALRQLIERAHSKGVVAIGGTLTPGEGGSLDTRLTQDPRLGRGPVNQKVYSPAQEAMRQSVNQWIRTSGAFDGVIDFDQIVRDPARPSRLLSVFDIGDHVHLNDAGHKAVGEAIDLSFFH